MATEATPLDEAQPVRVDPVLLADLAGEVEGVLDPGGHGGPQETLRPWPRRMRFATTERCTSSAPS